MNHDSLNVYDGYNKIKNKIETSQTKKRRGRKHKSYDTRYNITIFTESNWEQTQKKKV